MEATVATEHALAVGREAVTAGLADRETVLRLYTQYTQYLQQGTSGTFTQLLRARGVIDEQGFQRLETRVPAPAAAGSGSGLIPSSSSPEPSPELVVETTMEFDRVLPAPAATAAAQAAADAPGGVTLDVLPPSDAPPAPSDPAPARRGPEPIVGDVVGGFELLEILGRGGMGIIFKVRQQRTNKEFALKTLIYTGPAADENKNRERFLVEVEALRRLSHEGIVGVHASGQEGSIDWYVMDLIAGDELKKHLKEGRLDLWDRLEVFEEVCLAIEHAHERGIIHRDLKPENIIVLEDNKVKVLDFGLAKLADEDQSLTRTGAALGTPYYMAPEQLLDPKGVDFRADIHALGAMLYELATGRVPYMGETFGVISNKIMNEVPEPPTRLNPKLHGGFDAICLKALEKDREQRWQDVGEMRRAVARYRRGTRGASGWSLKKDAARRFFEQNRPGLIAGLIIASIIYIPLLILALIF